MGWMPGFPTFDRNPLELADEAAAAGVDPAEHVVSELKAGRLGFAVDDPSAPSSFPRVFFVWRSNLLGSSGKGQEYFLRHLLGARHDGPLAEPLPADERPASVRWREEIPRGKLDLLVNVDFRMTTTGLYSDVVLPAATWYEKYDLSMTDMHPFVHSFNQAVPPPWEARTDWDTFDAIARTFSELAAEHLGVRRDVVATPVAARHARRDRAAARRGRRLARRRVRAGARADDAQPDRRRARLRRGGRAVGGARPAGRAARRDRQERVLDARPRGRVAGRAQRARSAARADGRPSLERAEQVAEAMLALSGVTNGRLAVEGFRSLEERCGVPLADLAEGAEETRITLPGHAGAAAAGDHLAGVVGHRRGGPRLRRVHDQRRARQALAHAVGAHALLPRPRVDARARRGAARLPAAARPPPDAGGRAARSADDGVPEVTLRYLTPHSKWSIHSEYQDNLHMLTLFRGGSGLWMSPRGRRGDRRARQRLGRGVQPQRRRRHPRRRLAPRAAGRVPDVPLQGPPDRHAAHARSTDAAAAPRTR